MNGNTSLPTSNLVWDNQTGGFVIQFTADRYITPGDLTLILSSERDDIRHLNPANTSAEVFLRVRATFDVEYDEVAWGGHSINGSVTVRDYYTSQIIPDIAIEAHLRNES